MRDNDDIQPEDAQNPADVGHSDIPLARNRLLSGALRKPIGDHISLNVYNGSPFMLMTLLKSWFSEDQDMRNNWKWYTVFRGWDPGVYGTWYNHAATIAREVHDQLTLEEALAELDEIPPPPLPPRMWIEELYEAKGVPLPRSPSFDEEPRTDLFP
ncbi:hypothetical protein Syun_023723 [Stephania yunnanensis]|uniref:Uncharacterized protein n=1 Tax=Stephania yunnanensis TaxID=152371 RepID=A0AAP0I2F8_9MAGN